MFKKSSYVVDEDSHESDIDVPSLHVPAVKGKLPPSVSEHVGNVVVVVDVDVVEVDVVDVVVVPQIALAVHLDSDKQPDCPFASTQLLVCHI